MAFIYDDKKLSFWAPFQHENLKWGITKTMKRMCLTVHIAYYILQIKSFFLP